MAKRETRVVVRVEYWRGTTPMVGKAYTYAGAMRIAAKNQNAYSPSFFHGDRKLIDDGYGLAYADEAEKGRVVYAA